MKNCFYFHLKNLPEQYITELESLQLESWDELAEYIINLDISRFKKDKLSIQIESSKNATKNRDWNYFQNCTESKNQYRF